MKSIALEYFKWFFPMCLIGYLLILVAPIRIFGVIALVLAVGVPVDRIRVDMLKNGKRIPPKALAWKLIGLFLIVPSILAIYIGFASEVPEGQYRANIVVSSLLVILGPFLLLFCIQFLSKKTWEKGLKKYGAST